MTKQTKWLLSIVVILIALNLALIATILWHKNEAGKHSSGNVKNYFGKELSLTKTQEAKFDSLRKDHFKRAEQIRSKIDYVKERLFSLLKEQKTDLERNRIAAYLAQKISELQKELDMETFQHFSKLRSLLNAGQQPHFDRIIQDIFKLINPTDSLRTAAHSTIEKQSLGKPNAISASLGSLFLDSSRTDHKANRVKD
ncbi:MAG TPA: hypothetical protein VF609_02600 [Flavisolibacter sp.]|jgi:Spy/CpxP family protein refolding chaperone